MTMLYLGRWLLFCWLIISFFCSEFDSKLFPVEHDTACLGQRHSQVWKWQPHYGLPGLLPPASQELIQYLQNNSQVQDDCHLRPEKPTGYHTIRRGLRITWKPLLCLGLSYLTERCHISLDSFATIYRVRLVYHVAWILCVTGIYRVTRIYSEVISHNVFWSYPVTTHNITSACQVTSYPVILI